MWGQGISAKITIQMGRRKFLRYTGSSMLAGAAGLAASRMGHSMPGWGKVDRRKLLDYPTVSLKEKERRWNAAWKMMQDQRVDALIMPARSDIESHCNYFTNDPTPLAVFFPRPEGGEPVALLPGMSQPNVDWLMTSLRDGPQPWIKDVRIARGLGPELVEMIKARKMANSRIGTIDVFITPIAASGVREKPEEWNADPLGLYLKNNLPEATFVELFDEFLPIWATHSEEEIVMARKTALALEATAEAFIEACKPGNTVSDLQMAILGATVPYGIDASVGGSLYTGAEGGRGTRWMGRGFPPLVIKQGYLVHTEIVRHFGHMRGDVQLTVSVGKPSQEIATLARLARESYEVGLKTLRPGVTFGQLAEAMAQPNKREGAWNLTPFCHLANPNEARSMLREGLWENYTGVKERFGEARVLGSPTYGRDLVIREGMLFAFEPNSMFGRKYVNIGGELVVRKDGPEELNDIFNRMVVVNA